jgi:hypothetical protein
MNLAGHDQHHVARMQRVLDVPFEHDAVAFEHKNLVFVRVAVFWRISAWFDFELPHGKIGRALLLIDQPANLAADGALHGDRRLSHLFVMLHFHAGFSPG